MKKFLALISLLTAVATLNAQTPLSALPKDSLKLFLQPVEVRALRAGEKAPFTKTDLNRQQIEKTNIGQDLPFLLNQTPSVVINSDAGNGVGYTGIYIRGTDDSRINMTLNGIPYNDAEEQAIFFVDLPDFASSVNSIQIQRGVGTSSNGAGAFGATINFSTNEFNEKPYAEFNNSFGSFNTWKNTLKAGSGLIDGHFTIDMRLSRIASDGYIDRATSDLRSLYFSAAWYDKNSSLRFNILQGKEKTYQAWNGIPQAKWDGNQTALQQHYDNNIGSLYFNQQDSLNLFRSSNRTYNYFTYKDQTDNYWQNHYQLFFNHQWSNELTFNSAVFLTRGYGYFQEYHDQGDSANAKYTSYGLPPYIIGADTLQSTNLIRQRWLDNYFYGSVLSLQYKRNNTELILGGGYDRYDGKHYGYVLWAANGGFPDDYRYYYEPAIKIDYNVYAKWQQQFGQHWTGFADVQWRHLDYELDGFDDNPAILVHPKYNFVNPKAGITYTHYNWQAYFSYAMAGHEPNREDFEAGVNDQPKPERLHDFELGLQRRGLKYSWGVTGYYMLYHNQLVLTGKINDVGDYTRSNIARSYRLGIELQGSAKPVNWLSVDANLALSQNKAFNYVEYDNNYDNGGQVSHAYNTTTIAFSPAVVGAATLNFMPGRHFTLSLPAKYVSKEYLDNAQQENRKLDGYYVQNLRAVYTLTNKLSRETDIIFQLNNVFNKRYTPNGYTTSYISGGQLQTDNFVFPMAGTNFMVAVNIKL
ncbi:TonB-dependent receptor [Puia dinghuensis]|uniref:TonB-dependent receptor n=1 Tax=Puia dinghuensis TaxID=1792502 RepID=A0A8J2UIS7_9BACT|nr:TonB-dependent receptor plug domain-containing protein [Puia dinghuensis]GGB21977.1 TonB-dependent receptor [Puia dinghuensis]